LSEIIASDGEAANGELTSAQRDESEED